MWSKIVTFDTLFENVPTIPIVVGKLAAQTPSRLSVFSSIFEATTKGGAQAKHANSPGLTSWMWPELKLSKVF